MFRTEEAAAEGELGQRERIGYGEISVSECNVTRRRKSRSVLSLRFSAKMLIVELEIGLGIGQAASRGLRSGLF
jgi:hypothetical protein